MIDFLKKLLTITGRADAIAAALLFGDVTTDYDPLDYADYPGDDPTFDLM